MTAKPVSNRNRKQIVIHLLPIIFFLILLIIGVFIHDDYGGYTDELVEIQTAVVNAKYIFSKIPFLQNISGLKLPIHNDFSKIPDLLSYEDRIYGTAVMFPTILIGEIPGIDLSLSSLLNLRRFYVFLNYLLAMICFYFLLKARFKNYLAAWVGTLMLTLTPRFFAESFYNCKDIVFFSWFMITFCAMGYYYFYKTRWGLVLFIFAFGLTVNTRFYGVIFLPAFWVLILFQAKQAAEKPKTTLIKIAGLSIVMLIWVYLLSPYLWELNWQHIFDGIIIGTEQLGIGDAELFMGKLIVPRDVWYYIPVWIGITVPLLYLLFFIPGCISLLGKKDRNSVIFDRLSFALLFLSMFAIILSNATIYHGWRHAYFLYAPIIFLSVCGFETLRNTRLNTVWANRLRQPLLFGITGISFLTTGIWMVQNHPLDFVYFNEIGRNYADQFSRDYWGVASKNCLLYLDSMLQEPEIRVGVNSDLTYGATEFTLMRLPEKIQERFTPIWQIKNADFLCFSYKNTPGNEHEIPDFELMTTFTVDGYAVNSVYRRIQFTD